MVSQTQHRQSFFQWIGETDDSNNEFLDYCESMSQSFPHPLEFNGLTIRNRTLNARRLSVASLNSLTSFSTTLAQDGRFFLFKFIYFRSFTNV